MPEPLVIEATTREGLRRLYTLRTMLLAIAFERSLYEDPFADMDQVYATLFERYMLIPLDGNLQSMWASESDLVQYPVTRQNHLYAKCIAAQTFHYLTEKYGSVLDHQGTREFLVQNYYRFGGVDDWQTLLARGTGEELNPDYYLEFPCD